MDGTGEPEVFNAVSSGRLTAFNLYPVSRGSAENILCLRPPEVYPDQ